MRWRLRAFAAGAGEGQRRLVREWVVPAAAVDSAGCAELRLTISPNTAHPLVLPLNAQLKSVGTLRNRRRYNMRASIRPA